MKPKGDETRPDPLDEYVAAYLRAIDAGASLNELREMQNLQREKLAAAYADDAAGLADLDAKLLQFFEDHTQVNQMADAFRVAPAITIFQPESNASVRGPEGAGEVIGNYEIVKQLGRGGMGVVHQARHRQLTTWFVAIKRLLRDEANLRARFEREIQALAALKHENIIAIYEFGEHQGRPYFVMEFTEGGSLADYLHSLGQPDWSNAPNPGVDLPRLRGDLLGERLRASVELMVRLSSAMAHAHSRGVLHRDLKPGNVLLQTEPGQSPHLRSPRIADLGLAKLLSDDPAPAVTRADAGLGTPYYAAPEQLSRSAPVKAHADIYSLGALLYELLTGEPPHRAEYGDAPSLPKVIEIKRREPPPPHVIDARVPLDLSAICAKCLRVEPAHRFESAQQLVDELQRWLDGKPILTRHQTTAEKWRAWYRQEPMKAWLWTVSAVATIMVVASIIGWSTAGWQAAQRRLDIAQQKLDKERDQREKYERTAEAARKPIDRAIQLKGEARNFRDPTKLQAAFTAAREAEIIVNTGEADASLRQSVATLLHELQREIADRHFLANLDRARLYKAQLLIEAGRGRPLLGWLTQGDFIYANAQTKYLSAFQEYGMDLDNLNDDAVVRALRASSDRVREEAAMALVELAMLRGGVAAVKRPFGRSPLKTSADQPWVRFFLIAKEIDDNPWRSSLRDTLLETNWLWLGRGLERRSAGVNEIDLPVSNVCFLAEIRAAIGESTAAIALLRKAEQRQPNDALICCYLAFLEARRPKPNWSDVTIWYRAAVAIQPDSAIIRNNLGLAYFQQQKYPDALIHLQAATDLDPNFALAWYNQGVTLHQLGKLPKAADAWRKATLADRRFPEALQNLATAVHMMGDIDEALGLFDESVKLDPNNPTTHYNFGNALVAANDLTKAREHYRRAVELKDDFAWAYCDLGRTLQALGKLPEAMKHLEKGHALMKASGDPQLERAGKWILHCRRLAEFDSVLPNLVNAEITPTAAEECVAAAQLAALRDEHPTAVRLYRTLLNDRKPVLNDGHFGPAACSAALAGCGIGRSVAQLNDAERAGLREQALNWLRADLEAAKSMPEEIAKTVVRLKGWQRDPRLACVRDDDRLASFPERERVAWVKFWADVKTQSAATSR